jgi:hypothetical protein
MIRARNMDNIPLKVKPEGLLEFYLARGEWVFKASISLYIHIL